MKHIKSFYQTSSCFAAVIVFASVLACNAHPAAKHITANTIPQSVSDELKSHTLTFKTTDTGIKKDIPYWGLDLSWPNPDHIWRGVDYMGNENISFIRMSFPMMDPLVNGDYPASKNDYFTSRLEAAKLAGDKPFTLMPDTEGGVNPWFKNGSDIIPERWRQAMIAAQRRYGKKMHTVEPFNEPDYGWGQGSVQNLSDIMQMVRNSPEFNGVQIAGPSTLNDDVAEKWYLPIKQHLTRGTTHTLAGNCDNYINFLKEVAADGKIPENPEAHNLSDVILGAEYGMQRSMWWGTAEMARGEFIKAARGVRLAYAEDRPRFSASAVYRSPSGKIQAFLGCCERTGEPTTYRFICRDRKVWFNGEGPTHDYNLTVGRNHENLVNITYGRDIAPTLSGRYIIVNRLTHKVLTVADANVNNGAAVCQQDYTRESHQQWDIAPSSPKEGDQSYFTLKAVHSGKALDMTDWSHVDGGPAEVWGDGSNEAQQWYFDYAGGNYFYIRSRWSTKCLEVPQGSNRDGARIKQASSNELPQQQWRIIPVSAWPIKYTSPNKPAALTASPRALAIALRWKPNNEADIAGYTIYRSMSPGGPYDTIARGIKDSSFIDNDIQTKRKYYYVICAVDHSLNQSNLSAEAGASATGGNTLGVDYRFAGNLSDSSGNGNECEAFGSPDYMDGPNGMQSIGLNGTDSYLRMPALLSPFQEEGRGVTVAAWVYYNGGYPSQRIFDFGNDSTECLYLTPNSGDGKIRLAVRYKGREQALDAPPLPQSKWVHVAITITKNSARLYVNGKIAAKAQSWLAAPNNFKPIFNYIGKSQVDTDPLFTGRISDFRIYNYGLSNDQIAKL